MNKLSLFVWRTHTTILVTIGVALILVSLVVSFMLSTFQPTIRVSLGSSVYSLRLADSEDERVKGLSGVNKLGPNEGLLMQFDTDDTHDIWMKDMNIPLDIIWLDSDKKVIYIVKNAPPEDPVTTIFEPKSDARYVIELPAGSVTKAGIKTDSLAEFTIDV